MTTLSFAGIKTTPEQELTSPLGFCFVSVISCDSRGCGLAETVRLHLREDDNNRQESTQDGDRLTLPNAL